MRSPEISEKGVQKYICTTSRTHNYIHKKLSITWVGYIGLTCGLIFGLDVQIFWVRCSNFCSVFK